MFGSKAKTNRSKYIHQWDYARVYCNNHFLDGQVVHIIESLRPRVDFKHPLFVSSDSLGHTICEIDMNNTRAMKDLGLPSSKRHKWFKCVYLYEKKKYFTVIPEDWMVKIEEPCFMLDVTSFNMHTGVIGWAMRFHIEDRKQK